MADNSKKTTKKTTKRVVHTDGYSSLVKMCAFWGIFLAAVLFVASGILSFFDIDIGRTIIAVFEIIGKLALLVAVAFPAYTYVRGKAKVWKIIFWVVLVVYIAGCVFSVINL